MTAPVIVIDLQTGMLDGKLEPVIHDAESLVANTRAVLAWARREGRKIAFIRHDGRLPRRSSRPAIASWPPPAPKSSRRPS